MRYLIVLLFILSGCGSPITNLYEYIPVEERVPHNKTTDAVLRYYFTDKAYDVLKDIPVLDGPTISGSYVSGANFWGSLASLVSLNGLGRKIIMSQAALRGWGVGALIHEYVHHLDSMTRDGDANFINIGEFLKEFHKLETRHVLAQGAGQYYIKMYPYAGDYQAISRHADRMVTNIFGIGDYSELVAFAAQYLKKHNNWPGSYKKVFRRIFK